MKTAENLLYIIIAVLILNFVFELILDLLNSKSRKQPVPAELKGIYEDDKYAQMQKYHDEKSGIGMIQSILSISIMLFVFMAGVFGKLSDVIATYTENEIWQGLIFFGILALAADVLNTPFSLYNTFVIEEKYGFNKTTAKTYITDKLKGWIVGAILGGGIYALLVVFYKYTGEMFWIWGWILVTGFSIVMAMFYTSLLLPLFNKLTPLPEGELKTAIENYSAKNNFTLKNIFIMDGSKRSTRANAFFSGLGPKKTIVLYDNLVNKFSVDEVVAVLAHEVGHYKKKHIFQTLTAGVLQAGIMFFILSLFVGNPLLSQSLGGNNTALHLGLISFFILYSPITFFSGILMNILSRKNEYEADHFARETYKGEALISGLKKLSADSFSNLTPHPLYVFVNYSHPTLLQRVKALTQK